MVGPVSGRGNGGTGVYGYSTSGWGVHGTSETNTGVFGYSRDATGSHGLSRGGWGVHGWSVNNTGIFGVSENGYAGVHGINDRGIGVVGIGRVGVLGRGETIDRSAGYFDGNVNISGNLSKAGGGFTIDHPRDPANKYLNHSFVESSQMINFYDGIVTVDEDGTAWVDLPEWLDALNADFRYQLTPVGGSAPNLHVAEEIYENHRFKIAGGKARTKVCWQVTGSRKDAWAIANPIKVEDEKPPQDRGRYLHPHLYNAPPEQRVRIGGMDDEKLQMMRPGHPQAPEMPPSYFFEMKTEHLREVNELREQIEEMKRSRLEEDHRRQIEELRRQVEELRRR
jgi:hypothetical protein